ncbi:SUMF1/EgtB/PvdO family nonheme iron enzyme [Brumimicrobium mesophilum]|uniref:SUMF1/EgtB/PvdO family nonheme iron enzyme n=1 Tax=Brumimicrobium mesophilum TaxID=392717 RepID=UPI000D14081F|nr:SUMF1/EgtB/PvdO family nonheme iron enzyme [Brumimicrobium mesophilum]
MKPIKLTLLFIFSFLFSETSFGQFYPVPEMTVEPIIASSKTKELLVTPFSISEFISVGEFKTYMEEIKRDSTLGFYETQLPKSITFSIELFNNILKNEALQNKPMPGVSWTVAQNYCNWLTEKSKLKGRSFEYDLPIVSELIAYYELYNPKTDQGLESWTLNAYDESMFELSEMTVDYQYNAKTYDPPALKRKVIYGGSYHMEYSPGSKNDFHLINAPYKYIYQDSSSRYVGFRVVRKSSDAIKSMNDSLFVNADFGFQNNHFNGIYHEKYQTGETKVLGEFFKGQRIGIWSVWDSTGVLKVQRNYSNNRSFEFVYPVSNHPYKEIYAENPSYVLERNDKNLYKNRYLKLRSVAYSARGWKQFSEKNEPELFNQIDLKSIVKQVFEQDLTWYFYENNGSFKNELTNEDLLKIAYEYDSWDFSRVEIKEDFIINTESMSSETRQIGMAFYTDSIAVDPTYLLYFPSIRSILSKHKIVVMGRSEIEHLDDAFFFNAYRGKFIKPFQSVYNHEMKNDKEDLFMEFQKLSAEHDFWVAFGR